MPEGRPADVTALLLAWRRDDPHALDELVPLVYRELRRLAHRQMKQQSPGHVLQTTALIHEACLRLLDASRVPWNDRTHFVAVAARVMRRVLVEEVSPDTVTRNWKRAKLWRLLQLCGQTARG